MRSVAKASHVRHLLAFWFWFLSISHTATGGHATATEGFSRFFQFSSLQRLLGSFSHRPQQQAEVLIVGRPSQLSDNSTEKIGGPSTPPHLNPTKRTNTSSNAHALLRKIPLDTNPPVLPRKGKKLDIATYYAYDQGPSGELPPQPSFPQVTCRSQEDCPSPRHTCLRGGCTCPPILRGSADCTKPTPLPPERHYCFSSIQSYIQIAMDPKNLHNTVESWEFLSILQGNVSDLPQRGSWASCAVVASGAELRHSKAGSEIDSHSAVFRFNDAPTKGHEAYAGSKTTVRIQNLNYCSFAENESEVCLTYTGTPERCLKKSVQHPVQRGEASRAVKAVLQVPPRLLDAEPAPDRHPRDAGPCLPLDLPQEAEDLPREPQAQAPGPASSHAPLQEALRSQNLGRVFWPPLCLPPLWRGLPLRFPGASHQAGALLREERDDRKVWEEPARAAAPLVL
mmetsp:Transcript_7317/g.20633  ORF Transcript_7317/g.20633 Transcript_7317/m.20633 type:complete len:453 (-) Transcript_7317:539-1897(-)